MHGRIVVTRYHPGMYVAKIPNRNCSATYLLGESYREIGRAKNRALANLSHRPIEQIQLHSRVLKSQKLLPADVQQALGCLKSLDWLVRPIHHRLPQRVKAPVFICLLADYVPWHLKQPWPAFGIGRRALGATRRRARSWLACARPTADLQAKKTERRTRQDNWLQSFCTRLNEPATMCQTPCQPGEANTVLLVKLTEPTPIHMEASCCWARSWSRQSSFFESMTTSWRLTSCDSTSLRTSG